MVFFSRRVQNSNPIFRKQKLGKAKEFGAKKKENYWVFLKYSDMIYFFLYIHDKFHHKLTYAIQLRLCLAICKMFFECKIFSIKNILQKGKYFQLFVCVLENLLEKYF